MKQSQTSQMNRLTFFWKDSLADPIEHLTKLSQYAGAYAIATVDKATEVRVFLRQKSNSSEKMKKNMAQFQKYLESLKLQNQEEINEKQAQMEETMTRLQSQPQLEKFIKEELDVNAKLKQQQEVFFQQASIIDSYCDSNEIVI